MKLIITIVKDSDSLSLLDALAERRIGATRLASTGGFLREGNTTLLIGVEDDRVDEVIRLVEETCPRRAKAAPQFIPDQLQMVPPSVPLGVETGGAIVFVAPVERFVHI
ncbi:MAG TPA: hypothetical protein GXX51_04680 [Firmicutes bacterium]|nr:hypothetical protein [Bacillota bacterium]